MYKYSEDTSGAERSQLLQHSLPAVSVIAMGVVPFGVAGAMAFRYRRGQEREIASLFMDDGLVATLAEE